MVQFFKNWTLPIAMLAGILGYFAFVSIPILAPAKPFVNELIGFLQPLLIFAMLFLSFCKVNPHELRLSPLHLWLLLVQVGTFSLLGLLLYLLPDTPYRVIVEAAMICMITPTATAAAVVNGKLGGNTQSLVSYTIAINIASAICIPLVLSLVGTSASLSFLPSFLIILHKVFPLLIFPFLAAWVVRVYLPKWHRKLVECAEVAFYLWAVALVIALAVTVRSIVHSNVSLGYELGIAGISLLCCIVQFAVGKTIGARYHDRIGGGQSLGQKNTVFSIWLGATFLSPVTAIAGGFYSVWHNLFNSYQLYRKRHNH